MILMKIEELRKEIDKVDEKIVNLLVRRDALVKEIAQIKKKDGITVKDQDRENEIIVRMKKKAINCGLDGRFVEELFKLVLKKSKEEQENETV